MTSEPQSNFVKNFVGVFHNLMINVMAEGKKSFVFYADWIDTFRELPKEKGYDLLMHMLAYVNDEDPVTDDVIIKAIFPHIKNTLKRDLNRWETKKEENSLNGRMGNLKRYNLDVYKQVSDGQITLEDGEAIARARKSSPPDNGDRGRSPEVANLAVSVNDSVSVNDIDSNSIMSGKPDDTQSKRKVIVYNTDVDLVYYTYPAECPVRGASNGRCSKNKDKIRALLKNTTAEDLIAIIKRYESECIKTKTFMKNFTTFLNNIPDYDYVLLGIQEPKQGHKNYLSYEDLK